MPEQGGEKESRRGGLSGADAAVGIFQRQHDKALTERLFEDDVK